MGGPTRDGARENSAVVDMVRVGGGLPLPIELLVLMNHIQNMQ